MAEYWQDVQERAQATVAVWEQYFSALSLGSVGLGEFKTLTEGLPGLAQARDDAAQELDEARQARDVAAERLRRTSIRVPLAIEGMVDPESGLLDDLNKVYGVEPRSLARVEARGRRLVPVWVAANGWLAGQTPPLPAIEVEPFTATEYLAALHGFGALKQAVANAEERDDAARGELEAWARTVERLAIRFLKAGRGMALPGSAEETALDTIPTSAASNLPATLGIRTLTQGGVNGLQLLVAYVPYALDPDESAVLRYQRLDVDPEWLEVAYDASGNAIGPFEVGRTVRVRTAVTNANGTREGAPRQLTLVAPPA